MLAALWLKADGGGLPVRWEAGSFGWMQSEIISGTVLLQFTRTACQQQNTDSQHVFLEGDMEGPFQTQK
jgi:hypothetical protein